jgi:SAM-dependent methyltransferase
MGASMYRRQTCRLCGSADLALALALKPTPPANAFVSRQELDRLQPTFPLDVFFCHACTHVQLLDVVDPRVLFENYVYVSGTSPSFVRHFKSYAAEIAEFAGLKSGDLVVDIGSNDGTLLKAFKSNGAKVLGIDPARDIAGAATAAGIQTLPELFDPALGRRIAKEFGRAKVVTANNVFAHIDDLGGVADGIREMLAPDGVFVFEVSYLLDVVESVLFDTIYHEHLAYHAVRPLIPFLQSHGLELIEAIRVPTHGGSLRGIAQLAGGPRRRAASVDQALKLEQAAGLDRLATYIDLAKRIDGLARDLTKLFAGIKAEGKTIAGFGAPAKATTLMYHFGIGPDVIDFIVDDSPLKQNLYTPGMHIPVLPAQAIVERNPDYLVILAWNFAEPIIAKNAAFRARGGRFIVPAPKLEIL